jgi:hypothetical protein
MTAQITDRVVCLNERYELIWDGCLVPYINERYQLNLLIGGLTTSCYRGYVAEYEIRTAHLYLCSLELFGMFDPRPKIAGIVGEDVFYKPKNKKREPINSHWVKFSLLQERIDVSGYVVLAQTMKGYEDYMDFASLHPHVCKRLLGITFVKGQPKQVEDFSQEAAEIRNQVPLLLHEATKVESECINKFSKKVCKKLW